MYYSAPFDISGMNVESEKCVELPNGRPAPGPGVILLMGNPEIVAIQQSTDH